MAIRRRLSGMGYKSHATSRSMDSETGFIGCAILPKCITPRFPNKTAKEVVHYNDSPESFAAFLQKTKEYVDQRPDRPKLITINSWNEWVEGSYLLPDMKHGYGYLNAVKRVINGEYDYKP